MSLLPEVERELLRVARIPLPEARPVSERPSPKPSAVSTGGSGGFWRSGPAVATVVFAVAVLVVTVVLLESSRIAAPAHPRGGLTRLLGVLDEPSSSADRSLASRWIGPTGNPAFEVTRPLVRYATTAPWGLPIFIYAPPIDGSPPFYTGSDPYLGGSSLQGELVGVPRFPKARRIVQFLPLTAPEIQRGAAVYVQAPSPASDPYDSPPFSHREDVVAVVPNGVAKVNFVLPRQPLAIVGSPIYPVVRHVIVTVHNNVAAAVLDEMCCYVPGTQGPETFAQTRGVSESLPPPMIWLSASGRVIKRIGDVAGASHVQRLPTPAPASARALAAERNAATPNTVWIAPRTGRPTTRFDIKFRALLNGAQYYLTFTQIRGSDFGTLPGKTGVNSFCFGSPLSSREITTLHPNVVRGSIWSEPIGPPALCPGKYRFFVGVANRGIFDPALYVAGGDFYKGDNKPFGSAVVIVRGTLASPSNPLAPEALAILVILLCAPIIIYRVTERRRVLAPSRRSDRSIAATSSELPADGRNRGVDHRWFVIELPPSAVTIAQGSLTPEELQQAKRLAKSGQAASDPRLARFIVALAQETRPPTLVLAQILLAVAGCAGVAVWQFTDHGTTVIGVAAAALVLLLGYTTIGATRRWLRYPRAERRNLDVLERYKIAPATRAPRPPVAGWRALASLTLIPLAWSALVGAALGAFRAHPLTIATVANSALRFALIYGVVHAVIGVTATTWRSRHPTQHTPPDDSEAP